MKKLFGVLLVLLVSVAAALWFREQGGFVIIRLGEWTLEMSVILFVGALLASMLLLYLLIGLLRRLFGLPSGVRRWWGERRQNRARTLLVEGLLRTVEGRYAEAEKLLSKDVDRSAAPLLHYLAAAVAAQRQGAIDRRDRYIAAADRRERKRVLAVGLVQAQLQLENGQLEQALAGLNYLEERNPHHPQVLKLLVRCCVDLRDWGRLERLLPKARRYAALGESELRELEQTVARHRLLQGSGESADELERAWQTLPKALREDNALTALYVDGLCRHERDEDAEKLLRARLQKQWDPNLLTRYGDLAHEPAKLLAQLEKWLRERPEDPVLLRAAGRQCLRNQLWGRARSYLEAAAARNPQPETYQTLGGLLEQLGETEAAREHYRRAIELSTGQPILAELSEAGRSALVAHGRPAAGPA